jgi:hypothetical protein
VLGADLLNRQTSEARLEVGAVILPVESKRPFAPLARLDERLKEREEVVGDVGECRL